MSTEYEYYIEEELREIRRKIDELFDFNDTSYLVERLIELKIAQQFAKITAAL